MGYLFLKYDICNGVSIKLEDCLEKKKKEIKKTKNTTILN